MGRSMDRQRLSLFVFLLTAAFLTSGCGSAGSSGDKGIGVDPSIIETGLASWYGEAYHGKPTASGEPFNMNERTAAHKTLPFGTLVEVEKLADGRRVVVRINDRGPHIEGRIIDVSKRAAGDLGMIDAGLADVALRLKPGS
jgi:rare lipoprotein A